MAWQKPLAQLEELLNRPPLLSPEPSHGGGSRAPLTAGRVRRGVDGVAPPPPPGSPRMTQPEVLAGAVASAVSDAIATVLSRVDASHDLTAEVERLRATAASQARALMHLNSLVAGSPRQRAASDGDRQHYRPSPSRAALYASAVHLPPASADTTAVTALSDSGGGGAPSSVLEQSFHVPAPPSASRAASMARGASDSGTDDDYDGGLPTSSNTTPHRSSHGHRRRPHAQHNTSLSPSSIISGSTRYTAASSVALPPIPPPPTSSHRQQHQPHSREHQQQHHHHRHHQHHQHGSHSHSYNDQHHAPAPQAEEEYGGARAPADAAASPAAVPLGPAALELLAAAGWTPQAADAAGLSPVEQLLLGQHDAADGNSGAGSSGSAGRGAGASPQAPYSATTIAAVALAHSGHPEPLCAELLGVAGAAKQASGQVDLLKRVIERLRQESTSAQGALASTVDSQRVTIDGLKARVGELQAHNDRLVAAAEVASGEAAALRKRVSELTSANERLVSATETLRTSLDDAQRALRGGGGGEGVSAARGGALSPRGGLDGATASVALGNLSSMLEARSQRKPQQQQHQLDLQQPRSYDAGGAAAAMQLLAAAPAARRSTSPLPLLPAPRRAPSPAAHAEPNQQPTGQRTTRSLSPQLMSLSPLPASPAGPARWGASSGRPSTSPSLLPRLTSPPASSAYHPPLASSSGGPTGPSAFSNGGGSGGSGGSPQHQYRQPELATAVRAAARAAASSTTSPRVAFVGDAGNRRPGGTAVTLSSAAAATGRASRLSSTGGLRATLRAAPPPPRRSPQPLPLHPAASRPVDHDGDDAAAAAVQLLAAVKARILPPAPPQAQDLAIRRVRERSLVRASESVAHKLLAKKRSGSVASSVSSVPAAAPALPPPQGVAAAAAPAYADPLAALAGPSVGGRAFAFSEPTE